MFYKDGIAKASLDYNEGRDTLDLTATAVMQGGYTTPYEVETDVNATFGEAIPDTSCHVIFVKTGKTVTARIVTGFTVAADANTALITAANVPVDCRPAQNTVLPFLITEGATLAASKITIATTGIMTIQKAVGTVGFTIGQNVVLGPCCFTWTIA